MDKSNKIIMMICAITGISFVIIFLVSILFQGPTFESILSMAKYRMNQVRDIDINYDVEFLGLINGTEYNETGAGFYSKDNNVSRWSNNITFLGTSLFNMDPEKLIQLLELNEAAELKYEVNELVDCYMVSSITMISLSESISTLLGGYDYIKIDACLNQSNGYPIHYTMMVLYGDNGGMVSYTSKKDVYWV